MTIAFDDFDEDELDELEEIPELDDEFSDDDLDDFDEELDDFDDDLDDFDDDFEDDFDDELNADASKLNVEIRELHFSNINFRTAILAKNDMFALLCLKTANEGGAICRVDPRDSNPAFQLYDDPDKAKELYSKSIRTSVENGWLIIYNGLPLEG